jgi:uncharacterized protein
MPRAVLILAVIALVMYAAACLALFLAQRSFIYFPQPKSIPDGNPPLTLKLDGERILVSTGANALAGASTGAVIYFGGNAENVALSIPILADAFPDRYLYAMNYRGYGGSTGKPSETALITDALALFDHVHADQPNIIVIGRSLGSGVAVHLASERPVERLVLVTPYDSILNVAAKQFPYFPVRWLLLDKFESWRYAPKVTAITQLIAAQNDAVIPLENTRVLYKYLPAPLATLTILAGVDHNTVAASSDYIPLLRTTQ